jgi:hypothetical protein
MAPTKGRLHPYMKFPYGMHSRKNRLKAILADRFAGEFPPAVDQHLFTGAE